MKHAVKTILAAILILALTVPHTVSATTFSTLPEPEWTFTVPDSTSMYLRKHNVRITDKAFYFFENDRLYILDKKTGKQQASIPYLLGSSVSFAFFGSRAQVGANGNVYILTIHRNAAGAEKERLTAYSANGTKLWVKNFDETIRSNAGVTILGDGTLLIYLETASEKQVTYHYDAPGKLLGKQQWNGATYGFYNGYLPIYNWTGKASSRVTLYDSQLTKQFSLDLKFDEGAFSGIGADGYAYREIYNGDTKTSIVYTQNAKGKVIWKQTLKGISQVENFEGIVNVGKKGFSLGYTGILDNGDLFWVDKQGRLVTQSASATLYQPAPDNTIMLAEKSRVSIYQASEGAAPSLKLLYTMNTESVNNKEDFVYEGDGIIYYIKDNQIQRLNLADPTIRVYINGEKTSLGAAPQAINGTLMVPLRGTVEALGGSIKRLDSALTVTVGDNKVTMTVGQQTAMVNGKPQQLAVAPIERGGHTLVPLRFLSEALGAKVKWDQAAGNVHIDLP